MAEEAVLEPAKEKIKTDINDVKDIAISLEEKYGGKESVKKAKEKVAKEKEKKPEVIETIIPENKEVIVEKKEEKKLEAKKEEIKKEEKKIEVDAFYDPFTQTKPEAKTNLENKEIKLEPVKATEITAEQLEQNQKYQDYKKKAEAHDKLAQNPIFQALLEAEASGKPIFQVLHEISPKDYSYKGETDNEKLEVDRWRAKEYFQKIENLKGEELESAIDEFMDAEEGNRKRRDRNDHIGALTNLQEKNLKTYKDNLESEKRKGSENITNFQKEVDQFLVSIKEKKQLWGMQLTDAHIKSLEADTKGFFSQLFDEKGKINTQLIFQAAFFKNVQKDKNKEIAEKVKSDATLDVLEQVHLVDANDNSLNNRKPQAEERTLETTIEEKFGGSKST